MRTYKSWLPVLALLAGCGVESYGLETGDAPDPGSPHAALAGAAGGHPAGGSVGSAGTGGSAPVSCDAAPRLAAKCGQLGCHSSMDSQAGLDLKSPGVGWRLKTAPVPGANTACTDAQRTAYLGAPDPTTGFLFQKLSPTPPCGNREPQLPGWTDDDTACLLAWIRAGTP